MEESNIAFADVNQESFVLDINEVLYISAIFEKYYLVYYLNELREIEVSIAMTTDELTFFNFDYQEQRRSTMKKKILVILITFISIFVCIKVAKKESDEMLVGSLPPAFITGNISSIQLDKREININVTNTENIDLNDLSLTLDLNETKNEYGIVEKDSSIIDNYIRELKIGMTIRVTVNMDEEVKEGVIYPSLLQNIKVL